MIKTTVIKTTMIKLMRGLSVAGLVILAGGVDRSGVRAGPLPLNQTQPSAASQMQLQPRLIHYASRLLKMPRTYGLVLPPGYQAHPDQRYPVIFLLHGGHGGPTDWFTKGGALAIVQQLYAEHRLPPAIIVTPDGNDLRGSSPYWDPQYRDGPQGAVLSAIGDELVQEIRRHYRTLASPRFWAIGGLSSGGWGALNIGLHRLQTFHIMFSHSGYFVDRSSSDNSPLRYVARLEPRQRHQISIYLDAGTSDGQFLLATRLFHHQLDQLHISNVFHEFPGGHGQHGPNVGWNYWHRHLIDSLTFVGDRFKTAALAEQVHLPSTSQPDKAGR